MEPDVSRATIDKRQSDKLRRVNVPRYVETRRNGGYCTSRQCIRGRGWQTTCSSDVSPQKSRVNRVDNGRFGKYQDRSAQADGLVGSMFGGGLSDDVSAARA